MAIQAIPLNERANVDNHTTSLLPYELDGELFGTDDSNIDGNDLDNKLIGNDGNNILNGFAGGDKLIGSAGNDIYFVDNRRDEVLEFANEGEDLVVFLNRKYRLPANVERLSFGAVSKSKIGIGNSLDNVLTGNEFKNRLKGGGGDDVLVGFGGKDKLTGGSGADQFQFQSITDSGISKRTRDVITDFASGVDTISIDIIDAQPASTADQAFEFIGSEEFTDIGQARFANGILSLNIDDDIAPEFQVELKGVNQLLVSDIIF